MTASALYVGRLFHTRHAPRQHAFDVGLYMLYLDLDELPSLGLGRVLGVEQSGLSAFRRADYRGDAQKPLKETVLDDVQSALGERPAGPVRLLTHVRTFGYVFNPVSFYYCFHADGESLCAVLAEITNTPWRERHAYVLSARDGKVDAAFAKTFHVSPFLPMNQRYVWCLPTPGPSLTVTMQNTEQGAEVFRAHLALERQPLSRRALGSAMLTHPWMTLAVPLAIYFQAFRLWLKRTPFFAHPPRQARIACPKEPFMTPRPHAAIEVASSAHESSLFRRHVEARLGEIQHGRLDVIVSAQRQTFGRKDASLEVRLTIHDAGFYRKVALGGTLGAAESYMDGDYSVDDLSGLVRLILQNQHVMQHLDSGLAKLGASLARAYHAARRNTREGSRRNIAAHYDLGNEFFARMLDPTLSYSSAVFPTPESTLEEASRHKLDLLFQALRLRADERLLEIGTGWGGLALHAAEAYGARVTTTTISEQQYRGARARVEAQGLASRIELRKDDYRDLSGRYDKLVSVEMIEAVGAEYYTTFFAKCASLLVPGGRLALQAITIVDQAYEAQRREPNFIKRYIFPGSCIPSVTALTQAATRASDLRLMEMRDFGQHYARTVALWRANIEPHREWVVATYGERFWRMWMFYLGYCEAGFAEGYISVVHMLFERPTWSQA